jgi:8-oxo-dGTP pyrophosphatase MutT (NUDIX family)
MTIVPAVNSSSALIIRDNAAGELEILMVRRHANIRFAGGAYVFPGGKVDDGDVGFEEKTENVDNFTGLYFTCFREVFEETGLLLGGSVADQQHYREKLLGEEISFKEFMQQSGAQFSAKDFTPFAHWVTPDNYPKRFDTRFFLCRAPEGQIATPDGSEMVEARWVHPLELLVMDRENLMYPTMMNLKRLSNSKTVEEAFSAVKLQKIVTVKPVIIKGRKGEFRVIEKEAGYEEIDQSLVHPGIKD